MIVFYFFYFSACLWLTFQVKRINKRTEMGLTIITHRLSLPVSIQN
jgi:hypothetical protein